MIQGIVRNFIIALASLAAGAHAAAATPAPATPLFASDEPIRLAIRGPLGSIIQTRSEKPRAGVLTFAGVNYPVTLAARGITRKAPDVCQFPPIRVEFTQPPPAGSLFHKQEHLKLVTHCRSAPDFQQKVLLEYAAYRLYNLLTSQSFRARLATIDYVDEDGRPLVSRVGFFIEDADDVARRNGMIKPKAGDRVPISRLEPRSAGRFATFEYMIGNLDWSMRAGPVGEGCCHNGRLISANDSPEELLVAVPYDFDFSGLVDAPYATPPQGIEISSITERRYRGYCLHNAEARALAAEIAAKRGEMLALLGAIPGLNGPTRRKAVAYLDTFFAEAAAGEVLKNCVR